MYRENRVLKLETENKSTLSCTVYTDEQCIKMSKYDFTKSLEQDENITSRCSI